MQPDVHNNDTVFGGTVSFAKAPDLPSASITNAKFSSAASDRLAAAKAVHRFAVPYSQSVGSAVVAETGKMVHVAAAAGILAAVKAAVDTLATGEDRALTVDVKKSTAGGAWATVLSAVITIDDEDTAKTAYTGTIASAAYVAGDLFEIVVTVAGSASAQALGLGVSLFFDENPA